MPIFPLLGANHGLPLLHKDKLFIWIEETVEFINEFEIGYMIHPNLHINKAIR